MYLNLPDIVLLLHPILAITFVFPLIGLTVVRAWETRQRRLKASPGSEKLPPTVGREHLDFGKLLSAGVVGIALLGMVRPILEHLVNSQTWSKDPFQVIFIAALYAATIACFILLYKTQSSLWRGAFATLTGVGVVILGLQEGIFRRNEEWYFSHLYLGLAATLLMIFSLAIVPDIYRDRSHTWRKAHTLLNCVALLLFLAQGITGARDLLEIPLTWQKPVVYSCNFDPNSPAFKTCPQLPPPPQP